MSSGEAFWGAMGAAGFLIIYRIIVYLGNLWKNGGNRKEDLRKKKMTNDFSLADKWEEYSTKMEKKVDELLSANADLLKANSELLIANSQLLTANRDLQELNFKLQKKVDALHDEIQGLKKQIENSSIIETKVV